MRASGVPREELFITTKVSPYQARLLWRVECRGLAGHTRGNADCLACAACLAVPARLLGLHPTTLLCLALVQQGSEKAAAACEASLRLLGSPIELVLVHWPGAAKTDAASPVNADLRRQTWRVLERYHRQGLLRAIGCSNYEVRPLAGVLGNCCLAGWCMPPRPPHLTKTCALSPKCLPAQVRHLQELLSYAEVQPGAHVCVWPRAQGVSAATVPGDVGRRAGTRPRGHQTGRTPCRPPAHPHHPLCATAVNQVEVHPRHQQRELRAFCRQHGIAVVAYASLGCGQLLEDPTVQAVAQQEGVTPAQALLLWGLQHGCAVIPKSVHRQHIEAVAPGCLLGLRLSEGAMAALDGLEEERGAVKHCWDPSGIA